MKSMMKQTKYKKIGRLRISLAWGPLSFFNDVGQYVRIWSTPYIVYYCNRGTHHIGIAGFNGEVCLSIFYANVADQKVDRSKKMIPDTKVF